MSDNTIRARWNGEAFDPIGNWSRAWCMDSLKDRETVTLEVQRDRSMRSHRHQFAEIKELWSTLPEHMSHLPYARSPDALRKHALCATGYCDVQTIDAGSKAAAERVAAQIKRFADMAYGYSVVLVRGPIVTCYTPQSQSVRAMGGHVFQESKTKVLDWIHMKINEGATAQ